MKPVLPCPGMLQPRIIDVNLNRLMAMRHEIPRIEICDTEQAVVANRYLLGIALAVQVCIREIQVAQESRIVSIDHQDPHGRYAITSCCRRNWRISPRSVKRRMPALSETPASSRCACRNIRT